MGLYTTLATTAYMINSFMPNDKDWDIKIKKVTDEFWLETPKLPRKLKKKRRKELNEEFRFLNSMKNWKPFDY